MALERFSRSYEAGTQINPRGELLHLPEGQTVGDYLRALIQAGRLVIGIEGGDDLLCDQGSREQAFMFSSDFPHEVNTQTIRKEIRTREREEIRKRPSRRSCTGTPPASTSSPRLQTRRRKKN